MKSSTYKLFLCLVVSLFVAGSAFATDRYVNGQAGGEYMGLYATLQAALDDAVAGDVIYIYGDGEYPPVPGADPGNASYGGGAVVYDDNIMLYFVGDVVLNDGTNTLTALNLSGRTDITVAPDPVDGGTLAINGYLNGVFASAVTNLIFSDASFDGNTNGIKVNVTNGDFSALTITNGAYGFWLTGAAGATFDNCTVENNTAAGIVTNGSDVVISNCGLASNAIGIALNGTNVSVTDCDVTSGTTGLVINATGAVVTGCSVMANGDGFNLGTATGLDINNNTVKNNNNRGILVSGNAQGDIYDNNIQMNDIGIRVNYDYSALATSRLLNIYGNCLGDNDTYPAYDVNAYGAPTEVVWWSVANAGNYWGAFYDGTTASYFIPGGTNEDKYPTTATNNPTGPAAAALGEAFDVEFVFTIPALCDPFQFLKTCHFVVGYDDNLLEITGVTAGDYLPNVEMITNPVSGAYEIDLTALGDGNHATELTGILATAHFLAASDAAGTGQITVSSTYIDMNGVPITVTSVPLDYEVEDQVLPEIRQADLVESPTDDATYSAAFPLTLDWKIWDDFDLYRFQWRVLNSSGVQVIGWANVGPTADPGGAGEVSGQSTIDVTALTSGDYFLELRLRDAPPALNEVYLSWTAKSGALVFHVDNTAPAAPTFTIADADGCAAAGYTSGLDVIFTLSPVYTGTDMGKVQWAYAGDWRDILDYADDFPVTLDDFNGTHNMYVRIMDVYGNASGWGGPVAIYVDRSEPNSALFAFSVPTRTRLLTRNASVANWGGSGAYQYALSVDNVVDNAGVDLTCEDAAWQAVTAVPATPSFTLPDGPDGDYEVCMVTRDRAGNVSGTACDVIELDRTAPCFASFVVAPDNGMPCENTWDFDITMTFTNDPYYVRFWVDGGSTGKSSWILVTGDPMVYHYTILLGDRVGYGTYTIKGEVRDQLGNICETEGSGDIIIDGTNPTSGLAAVNGANSWPWSYSATATIPVTFPDASADALEAMVSEAADFAGATWQDIGATEITLTGAQCGWRAVYYKVRDCSGRESTPSYGYVKYDIENPDLTAFVIFGDAAVTKKVNLTLNITATDNCAVTEFIASEGDDDFTGDTWQDFTVTPYKYLLVDQNDGIKKIYVKVRDEAGHESAVLSDEIYLDRTPPTGTINLVANASCGAAAGYTCTLTGNTVEFSGVDADVVAMEIENCAGSGNMIVDPFDPATTSMVWNLAAGGEGNRCVHVKFKDAANNWSTDWISANIMYDITPPVWPGGSALVVKPTDAPSKSTSWGHAISLEWPAVADAQYYGFNWQRTTDYPAYDVPFPAFPPSITDEFFGSHALTGTSATFETLELPGIYFISLFVQDMAGNWSTGKLTAATTNYYLGDFGADGDGADLLGGLRIEDFQFLAQNYFAPGLHPYEQLYDIGPTHNGGIYGYPVQDGAVDFEDLVQFTFVYDVHPLAGRGMTFDPASPKPVVSGNLIVSADMPNQFHAGQEFETVLRINDPSPVKVMSLTLDYDSDLLEAISVQPGDVFDNDNAFLLNRMNDAAVQMDGTILGADNAFDGSEIAVIRFRAKKSGSYQFADPKMIFRDRSNEDIQVLFSNIAAPSLPADFALSQNRPNPFNPTTTFDLYLPTACDWRCDIFNVAGQIIKSVSGHNEAGAVPITWDGTDTNGSRVASGIYFYRLSADGGRFTQTKKMVLMK